MRIVIISWYFPPSNGIAQVRMGKMAAYFERQGHQVRILTAKRSDDDDCLTTAVEEGAILRLPSPASATLGMAARNELGHQAVNVLKMNASASLRRRLSQIRADIFHFPDKQAAWLREMVPVLRRLCGAWRPDILYVSGPPFSAFIGVARVAREVGIPWVAEFRDRWAENPYLGVSSWRRRCVDEWIERWIFRGVSGIVTVSGPWADFYAKKYRLPVATVMNGFDPADLDAAADAEPNAGLPLRILHAGTVYRDLRDPSALFGALRMGPFSSDEVKVVFRGNHLDYLTEQVERHSVGAFVEACATVPYREALRLQRQSDVLLLMQWNNPADAGNVPGKVFEYLAARRPILALGPLEGIPAQLIFERNAGLCSNDPNEIAAQLHRWIGEKREKGTIPDLPMSVRDGLTRDEQFARLERFLGEIQTGGRR